MAYKPVVITHRALLREIFFLFAVGITSLARAEWVLVVCEAM